MPSRIDDADHRPPATISGDVDRLLANLGAPPAPVLGTVAERWAEIVGPAAAEHSRPGGLVAGRLRIDVDSSAWASQLKWSESDIVGRAAELLGAGRLTAVEIRVRPRP